MKMENIEIVFSKTIKGNSMLFLESSFTAEKITKIYKLWLSLADFNPAIEGLSVFVLDGKEQEFNYPNTFGKVRIFVKHNRDLNKMLYELCDGIAKIFINYISLNSKIYVVVKKFVYDNVDDSVFAGGNVSNILRVATNVRILEKVYERQFDIICIANKNPVFDIALKLLNSKEKIG